MKRMISLALCLVLALTALASCSSGNKFSAENGRYVDKKTNIAYIDAPACYAPIAMGDKLYGTLDDVKLYEIVGADPQKFLAETTGTVFYADGVALPELWEMNISHAEILVDTESEISMAAADYAALIDLYKNGTPVQYSSPASGTVSTSVTIRFSDEQLGICYMLTYIELSVDYTVGEQSYGTKFLLNRFDGKRFIPVGDVIDGYLASES